MKEKLKNKSLVTVVCVSKVKQICTRILKAYSKTWHHTKEHSGASKGSIKSRIRKVRNEYKFPCKNWDHFKQNLKTTGTRVKKHHKPLQSMTGAFTIPVVPQIQTFVLNRCAPYKCFYVCTYICIKDKGGKHLQYVYKHGWSVQQESHNRLADKACRLIREAIWIRKSNMNLDNRSYKLSMCETIYHTYY